MKLYNFLITFILFIGTLHAGSRRRIIVNGIKREYLIYKPASLASKSSYPLVLDFHGGGGNASGLEKSFGFDNIADEKKFIVVYPEGLNKGWNDGRRDGKAQHSAEDVTFISLLIDKLIKEDQVDSSRIYAAGISNGAFFSIYLGCKLHGKLKAIAAVCGNILEDNKDSFALPKPISLLLINGTGDPIVKYEGGAILSERSNRGRSMSTDFTITKWLQADKINTQSSKEIMPDIDRSDGCTATKYIYGSGKDSLSVVLIKIDNGGHTWPGGKQYLPKFIIGKVCRDFDASEVIWDFFETH
jgi:polyhydroxybutyrate depolymerase